MKIAAYILATLCLLAWGFVASLGVRTYSEYWHQVTAWDAATMLAPVLIFGGLFFGMFTVRRYSGGLLLAEACALVSVTACGGSYFLVAITGGV